MAAIGERIKDNYEGRAKHTLIRRTPVIVRVDGKAFHTYTRGFDRPFEHRIVTAMMQAAQHLAGEMMGFKVGYVQSDEASFLLTDYDKHETEAWFGYVKSKVESISASTMTAAFNRRIGNCRDALFDARAFNVPREEIVNYFLWRSLDWLRNSVTMYCQGFFSHKQMHGKARPDQHEMLHGIGRNWATDLPLQLKNGTFIFADGSVRTDIEPSYPQIAEAIRKLVYCDESTDL